VRADLPTYLELIVEGWCNYLTHEQRNEPSTVRTYRASVVQLLQGVGEVGLALEDRGDLRENLTLSLIGSWYQSHSYKSSTVYRHSVAVRSFFTWCEKSGHFDFNPVRRWKVKRRRENPPYRPTTREVEDLIQFWYKKGAPHGIRNAAMLVVLAECGLRRSELVALRMQDVQERPGEDHFLVYVPAIKSADFREVPLGQIEERDGVKTGSLAANYLHRWVLYARGQLRLQDRDPLFPPIGKLARGAAPTREQLVQRFGLLKRMAPGRVDRVIKAATAATGVPAAISPHSLRRFFASNYIAAGVPAETVRQYGGWSSLEAMEPYIRDAGLITAGEATKRSPLSKAKIDARDQGWLQLPLPFPAAQA